MAWVTVVPPGPGCPSGVLRGRRPCYTAGSPPRVGPAPTTTSGNPLPRFEFQNGMGVWGRIGHLRGPVPSYMCINTEISRSVWRKGGERRRRPSGRRAARAQTPESLSLRPPPCSSSARRPALSADSCKQVLSHSSGCSRAVTVSGGTPSGDAGGGPLAASPFLQIGHI